MALITHSIKSLTKRLKRPLGLLVLLGLTACATTANYERLLSSWVGHSELDLVRAWGSPTGQYESGGVRFLTYEQRRNVFMPGTNPTYQTNIIGNTAYTTAIGGSPAYNIPISCRTTFEIQNQRITNWRWEGNGCRSQ
jgi:hypothetical protein